MVPEPGSAAMELKLMDPALIVSGPVRPVLLPVSVSVVLLLEPAPAMSSRRYSDAASGLTPLAPYVTNEEPRPLAVASPIAKGRMLMVDVPAPPPPPASEPEGSDVNVMLPRVGTAPSPRPTPRNR